MGNKLDVSSTFAALAMMGSLEDHLPHLLSKEGLFTLSLIEYFTANNNCATDDDQLLDPAIVEGATATQRNLRRLVMSIIEDGIEQESKQRQNDYSKAMQQFRDMNKVHEMGTVAEIAQKLGISKSEVRRRKANGTL